MIKNEQAMSVVMGDFLRLARKSHGFSCSSKLARKLHGLRGVSSQGELLFVLFSPGGKSRTYLTNTANLHTILMIQSFTEVR